MKQFGRWWVAVLAIACGAVGAQEWKPTHPVEFIVPSGAGGAADQYARAMGKVFEQMNLLNGQSWVPINRPSGTGVVALQALQQKTGNPHTITLLHTGIVISNLAGELKPTPSDFTEVSTFLKETMAVTVRADSTIATGGDLVASLKRDPGGIRFGYIGHHVLMSLVKPLKAAGVDITKLTLVPFKSSAEALTSLLGGHVDVVPGSTPNLVAMVGSGRVRALALSSPERLGGLFAQVPTWKEQGVNASFNSVYGVMLPAGVPPEAVRYWENAFQQLSTHPDWLTLLERNGAKPFFQNRAQTVSYFSKEREELAPLVKELGLGAK